MRRRAEIYKGKQLMLVPWDLYFQVNGRNVSGNSEGAGGFIPLKTNAISGL
jgi:hypothetical protein